MNSETSRGRRCLRMTPYVTRLGPRKIGNIPAQYTIRSPDRPVLAKINALTDQTTKETTTSVEREKAGCSYNVVEGPIEPQKIQSKDDHKKTKDLRYSYPKCYVEPSRSWTYKSDPTLALGNEQLYYTPDPFHPVPPSKGAPCASVRMHYASLRVDSLKYRAQQTAANEAKQQNMDSANCEKCNLRFFLPFNHMRSHISYSETTSRYDLPLAFFACPLCCHENQIVDNYKDLY